MTSSAYIGHILCPLVDPKFSEQDRLYTKAFSSPSPGLADQVTHDFLRNQKRSGVTALDWAGDKLLVASNKDNTLRLFDVAVGEKERSWSGDWMATQCDPNNPFVAAAVGWSGKFRVFDSRSSTTSVYDVDLKKSSPSLKDFLFLCWAPSSKHIALCTRSDQVFLLDLRVAAQLRLGPMHNSQLEVNQMVWGPDGDSIWLATGGSPGTLSVLPAPSLSSEGAVSVHAHQYHALSVAVDPTGKYVASGGLDCLLALWDPRHLTCVRTFGNATQGIATIGFNHTGNLLAWGTGGLSSSAGERNLPIVGTHTGTLFSMEPTSAPVQLIKWHPSRNLMAYALHASQLPDERDPMHNRRLREKDLAVVHTLKISDSM
mmetsp:Transcript_29392/g.83657  ORF Transcript_29392/g.83657 Transcript_29392/m.83657 type:complete len:372 (+) Transcript_29392:1-1116(+)